MTDQELRIAVAELHGWKRVWNFNKTFVIYRFGEYDQHEDGTDLGVLWPDLNIPDYPNDLNAMQEAELSLTPQQQIAYADTLNAMTQKAGEVWNFAPINAAARTRAEAFVRTLKP